MDKRVKKKNMELLIDGENIGSKKAEEIMNVAKKQGVISEGKVYGRQKDRRTKRWHQKVGECGLKEIRLCGGPEKNKVDKKIKKDARKITVEHKNVDVICIATNDGGYADIIGELRALGKRVVVIGEHNASERLRNSCNKFVEI